MKLKKIISFVLSFVMLISLFPAQTLAADSDVANHEYVFTNTSLGKTDTFTWKENTSTADGIATSPWTAVYKRNGYTCNFTSERVLFSYDRSSSYTENLKSGMLFKIRVNKTADYTSALKYYGHKYGAYVNVYLFENMGGYDAWYKYMNAIADGIVTEGFTLLGGVDTYKSGATSTAASNRTPATLAEVRLEKDKDYYLFITIDKSKSKDVTGDKYFYFNGYSFVLDEKVAPVVANHNYVFTNASLGSTETVTWENNMSTDVNSETTQWETVYKRNGTICDFTEERFRFTYTRAYGNQYRTKLKNGTLFKIRVDETANYTPELTYYGNKDGANTFVYVFETKENYTNWYNYFDAIAAGDVKSGYSLLGAVDTYKKDATSTAENDRLTQKLASVRLEKNKDYYVLFTFDSETSHNPTSNSGSWEFNLHSFRLNSQTESRKNVKFTATSNVGNGELMEVKGFTYDKLEDEVEEGTYVTVTAPSKEGYKFMHWVNGDATSNNVVSAEMSLSFNVQDNIYYTAIYDKVELVGIEAGINAPIVSTFDDVGKQIVVTPLDNHGAVWEAPSASRSFVLTRMAYNVPLYTTFDKIMSGTYTIDRKVSTGEWTASARLNGHAQWFYDNGFLYREVGDKSNLGNNGIAMKITVEKDAEYKPTFTYFKNKVGTKFNLYLVDALKMTVDSPEKITEVTTAHNDAEKGITYLGTIDTYDASVGSDWSGKTKVEFENCPTIDLKAQEYYLVLSIDGENSALSKSSSYTHGTTQQTGFLNNFALSEIQKDNPVKYENLTPDVISVSEDGYVKYVSLGTGKVKVSTEINGMPYETICEIVSGTQKTEPTFYTYEMREQAIKNGKTYDWAKSLAKSTAKDADKYVEALDFIYDHIPPEGIPRSSIIAMADAPTSMHWRCPHPECNADINAEFHYYAWIVDPLARPWKVQCPKCKRLYPSNDFGSFYKLGTKEDGTFSRDLAIEKNEELVASGHPGYLVNTMYSDMPEDWMVDAGFGWSKSEGYKGTKRTDRFVPIAYYTHYLWSMNGVDKRSFITKAVKTLRDAYLYTGEEKYGVAGAIILDRVADMYPIYDWKKVCLNFLSNHGGRRTGKTTGTQMEKEHLIEFIRSVDAFYPMAENKEVIAYLSEKSKELGLENPKLTPQNIRENWDNGILRESYRALNENMVYGSGGGSTEVAIAAGVILDCDKETAEYINWGGATQNASLTKSFRCPIFGNTVTAFVSNTGGGMYNNLFNAASTDRDGFAGDAAPGYLVLRYQYAIKNADLMANYDGEDAINIYKLPILNKMLKSIPKLTLGDGYTIAMGDSGSTAGKTLYSTPAEILKGFYYIKDPELAQIYYMWKGGKIEGSYVDMFTDNEKLVDDIKKVIQTYGEYKLSSENLAAFGMGILRGGERIKSVSGKEQENRYDTWMYYGHTNASHAHREALQFGVDAYGFNFNPDLGYPTNVTNNPQRLQWERASIAHNTVLVNEGDQAGTSGGTPLHFDDSGIVGIIDAEDSATYGKADIYRRTLVSVATSEKDVYTIDFFRVRGGDTHTYSFHSQSYMGYSTDDFEFVPQVDENGNYVGTYASPDVEYGADPAPNKSETSDYTTMYPRGYSWLINVNRGSGIKSGNFSVNFKQTDFNKQVKDSTGLNLKFTAVNDWTPSAVDMTTGLPPAKGENDNVPGLDYMLIHRTGEDGLDTLFTSVLQPYKGNEYIESVEGVDVRFKSGTKTEDDVVKAVKVTLKNKNADYIVYSTNKDVVYTISDNGEDVFDFSGFIGVYRVNENKKNIYTYLHDGTICGEVSAVDSYKGMVSGFTTELSEKNEIRVNIEGEYDIAKLPGKQIFIGNKKNGNGVYTIKNAYVDDKTSEVVLDIDDITLVAGLVDYSDISKGFTYAIAENESFEIPLTAVDNFAPDFEALPETLTTSAGSTLSVDVNATSRADAEIKYIGTVLPRGATVDAESGVITWKPDDSQVGNAGFLITARDADGRESVKSFEVEVYGRTTGGQQTAGGNEDQGTASGGGGGGGGGAAPTPDETDKSDESGNQIGDNGESGESGGNTENTGTENGNLRFTDLANHAWAADSINTLADDGVIKGTTATTYSPANNITRADFALLLVRAFELSSDNTENFADVSASDYFASELAIARNTGIVNGIGDNKYAPRNAITRQDMMVITYRALTSLEKMPSLVGEGKPLAVDGALSQYPDFDTVADYAKEAVSALIGVGLVNGKSGRIAPTDYTTRAEVAVLIKRILDHVSH